jgi:sec-independent protein translocase protein TatA
MLKSIGLPELLVIGAVAVLLFGGKRLGEFGKGLGQSIKEFKSAFGEAEDANKTLHEELKK